MEENVILEQEAHNGAAALEAPEDDWSDLDFSDIEAEDESTDEHQEQEAPETPDVQERPSPEPEKPVDQTEQETQQDGREAVELFELKYLGEIRQVTRDEVVTLAQKGMNYDHIHKELLEARGQVERLTQYEEAIRELAETSGMKPEDFLDNALANALIAREARNGRTLDSAMALERIRFEREKKALDKERARLHQQDSEAERRRQGFVRFAKERPDVNVSEIPKEVWDRVTQGEDLLDAYTKYENKRLREDIKALKDNLAAMEQNMKNRERTTGSRKTAGKSEDMDEFERAWYDGT